MLFDDVILEIIRFPFAKEQVVHFLENKKPKDVQDEQERKENPAHRHVNLQVSPVVIVFQIDKESDDSGKSHQAHDKPHELGR